MYNVANMSTILGRDISLEGENIEAYLAINFSEKASRRLLNSSLEELFHLQQTEIHYYHAEVVMDNSLVDPATHKTMEANFIFSSVGIWLFITSRTASSEVLSLRTTLLICSDSSTATTITSAQSHVNFFVYKMHDN